MRGFRKKSFRGRSNIRELAEVLISEGLTFTYHGGEYGYISRSDLDVYVNHNGMYQIRDSETEELVTYCSSPCGVAVILGERAE